MRRLLPTLGLLVMSVGLALAAMSVNKMAPDFSASGSDGNVYKLADYKGKFVVLQWYNRDCPFIHKHYDSGNMQKLQDAYGKKGVVWFEVISSAPGTEGYLTAEEAQANRDKSGTKSLATLVDPEGKIGRLYGAKTTPHIFIVDPKGIL